MQYYLAIVLLVLSIIILPLRTKTYAIPETHAKYAINQGQDGIRGLEEMLKHINEAISEADNTSKLKEELLKALGETSDSINKVKEAIRSIRNGLRRR